MQVKVNNFFAAIKQEHSPTTKKKAFNWKTRRKRVYVEVVEHITVKSGLIGFYTNSSQLEHQHKIFTS